MIGPSTFNLVALWAHYGKTPIRVGALGPTLLALRAYASLLLERPSIVAGDLNNHIRWDKPGKASNHANAVTASAALGLVSAYHAFYGLEQGAERHPSLYWRDRTRTGPTFHIDYIFVPRSATNRLRRVSVGSYAKWVATGLSDHAPLIVDFLSEFASKNQPNTTHSRLRRYDSNCKATPAGAVETAARDWPSRSTRRAGASHSRRYRHRMWPGPPPL